MPFLVPEIVMSIFDKKRKRLLFITFTQILIFSSTIASISNPDGYFQQEPLPEDTPAPNFYLTDITTNEPFSLADFRGKVVILDLFATWCGPCVQAIPKIREIYQSYSSNELAIISVDIDVGDHELTRDFIQEHSMEWFVAFDNNSVVANNYGTGAIPTLYVIDYNQVVAYSEIGFDFTAVLSALDQIGLEPTRTISLNGSFTPSLSIVPLIYIVGIGLILLFIIGAVIYGRLQQKRQIAHYPRFNYNHQQRILKPNDHRNLEFKVCPKLYLYITFQS
ncbi:MAG: TlpA family protein disulfide reductase [Promethearchaeota archaeon]